LSALGAVTGSGVFWVAEMKRDPLAPFESAVGTLLFMLLLGQDTSSNDSPLFGTWEHIASECLHPAAFLAGPLNGIEGLFFLTLLGFVVIRNNLNERISSARPPL
jgi:hypothetical protein